MTNVRRLKLAGSTDGRLIKVAATSTPGTAIHTAPSSGYDEMWLWAVNTDTTLRTLTLDFDDSATNIIIQSLPPESGLMLLVPGLLRASSNVVTAYASAANVVNVGGYVNRIDSTGQPSTTLNKAGMSQSITGDGTLISQTATPGNQIHASWSGTEDDEWDEIWVWAYNNHSAPVKLTIEFGGTSAPDDLIEVTIPNGAGLVPVIPGMILHNSVAVRAFAATGSVIRLFGYVNQIRVP